MKNQLVGTTPRGAHRGSPADRRERLLAAARTLVLERGFPATTIDQICEAAGVTKGAFFHYFDGKEAVGRAVLERFVADLVEAFRSAPFRSRRDPLDRVFAYIDFTVRICEHAILRDGCLLGIFSQELAETRPELRSVCADSFRGWAQDLGNLLEEAKARHASAVPFDARSVAEHFIGIVEGALILRKAYADPGVVERELRHFEGYVRLLFGRERGRRRKETQ